MAFEYQGKELRNESLPFISEKAAPTPFKALVACESSSAVQKVEIQSYIQLGVSWSQAVSQVQKCAKCFRSASEHTL